MFRQADFSHANLRDANLTRAHFFGTRLRGVDARGGLFQNVIFENTDLSYADLRDTEFSNARFIAVNLSSTDLRDASGLTAESFQHVCGDENTRLPFDYTLTRCSEDGALVFTLRRSSEAVAAVPSPSLETQRDELERVSAELEAALAENGLTNRMREREMTLALRQAVAELRSAAQDITVRINESESQDSVELAIEQATAEVVRDSLRVAARALAEAQANGDLQDVSWEFDIHPTELGDHIRTILEQAGPAPKPVLETPSDPAAAPVFPPKQPTPRMQAELERIEARRAEQEAERARRQQEAAQRAEERRQRQEDRDQRPQPPRPPQPPQEER